MTPPEGDRARPELARDGPSSLGRPCDAGSLLLGAALAIAVLIVLVRRLDPAASLTACLMLVGVILGCVSERLRRAAAGGQAAPAPAVAEPPASPLVPPPGVDEERRRLQAEKQRLESVLFAAMDPLVAKLVLEKKLRNEKRPLTVLFADLMDFTGTAEASPPEEVVGKLNEMFSAMEPVLTLFKGHVDKYLGDGLMAEFGAPYTAQNHPLLAVLAALRIQFRMREARFPWPVRIGVASGTALVGMMGSGNRCNYTAIGDTVNLASRLQALCPGGSVCVDERVFSAVQRWVLARRIRVGLTPAETRNIEAKLQLLSDAIETAPTAKVCLEAADLASELGDMEKALGYHRMALELDPRQRQPVERAMASALLTGEERAFVTIKGKRERVAVYEVSGLRDPLTDGRRVPRRAVYVHRWLESEYDLPEEWMLSVEALQGRVGHGAVTAALSGALAEALGLDDAQVRCAFLAGYFNDVGKKNVPEHLLTYGGRLADLPSPDQGLIRRHVEESGKVLSEMKPFAMSEVLRAIAQHHERFDGTGYPAGLKGTGIDLLARVVRVADTYEAITAWRPYQEAQTPAAALVEIARDMQGGAIDPAVGKVFLELMEELK